MKVLSAPGFTSREVLAACANSVQNKEFARRIELAVPIAEVNEGHYCRLGAGGSLFTLRQEAGPLDKISAAEIKGLYTGTLAKKGSTVRYLYDAIRLGAPNGICPLCNQRVVKTLDHYLSKDTHPQLAVTPANLVPSCSDCNKEKLNRLAKSASEQTLHPYFDNTGGASWLVANVVEASPVAAIYQVVPPQGMNPIMQKRLSTHFKTFGLAELYSTHAAVELVNVRFALVELSNVAGPQGVRSFLAGQAASRMAADRNSWTSALYAALAESNWYCEGGYKHAA